MKEKTFEERLELYTTEKGSKDASSNKMLLAASAVAGVGAILVPPPAEAAIVYSGPQGKVVSAGTGVGAVSQEVDFNGDTSPEFVFFFSEVATVNYQQVEADASFNNIMGTDPTPAILSKDEIISENGFGALSVGDLAVYGGDKTGGNFLGSDNGAYIGVQFEIGTNTHYGWIQYKSDNTASVGTIIDWAYEDTPDKEIKAGDTVLAKKFNWNLFLPAIINGNKNK